MLPLELVRKLTEKNQILLAAELLDMSLPLWEDWVNDPETELEYYAQMLGKYYLEPNIISDIVELSQNFVEPQSSQLSGSENNRIRQILKNYSEHHSGISHMELNIPYLPELVFEAGHNLLAYLNAEHLNYAGKSRLELSMQFSISALEREKMISPETLMEFIDFYKSGKD